MDRIRDLYYKQGYADGQRDARKHGHWENGDTCSCCGKSTKDRDGYPYMPDPYGYPFCPYCGAQMNEEEVTPT